MPAQISLTLFNCVAQVQDVTQAIKNSRASSAAVQSTLNAQVHCENASHDSIISHSYVKLIRYQLVRTGRHRRRGSLCRWLTSSTWKSSWACYFYATYSVSCSDYAIHHTLIKRMNCRVDMNKELQTVASLEVADDWITRLAWSPWVKTKSGCC